MTKPGAGEGEVEKKKKKRFLENHHHLMFQRGWSKGRSRTTAIAAGYLIIRHCPIIDKTATLRGYHTIKVEYEWVRAATPAAVQSAVGHCRTLIAHRPSDRVVT